MNEFSEMSVRTNEYVAKAKESDGCPRMSEDEDINFDASASR